MKKSLKNFVIGVLLAVSAFSLSGCGSTPADNSAPGTEATTTEAPKPVLTLSVGTRDNMKSYDYFYEKGSPDSAALSWDATNPDADILIAIIADKTGWNLNLASPVSVSPGSFIISFAADSSIYTGAVDSSKADFAIADHKELATTILDSIVANMNHAYGETLTIYFTSSDGGDIVVPGTDLTVSSSEPYSEAVEEEDGEADRETAAAE